MKNDIAARDQVVGYENALIQGDLSGLSAEQRLEYYAAVCKSVGLNPLTKPFDYITLNGKLTLYAKRDCTDQLRASRGVSVAISNRETIGDVYIVTARGTIGDRCDESTGAVPIGNLKGEALANALMKAETKAKRRVTLSLCGLGMLDETELETIPEARAQVVTPPQPAPKAKSTAAEKLAITREKLMAAADDDDFRDIEAKAINAGWATQEQVSAIWHDWSKTSAGTGREFEAMEAAMQAATPAKGFVEANR